MRNPHRISSLSLMLSCLRWCHLATTTRWHFVELNGDGSGESASSCSCAFKLSLLLNSPGYPSLCSAMCLPVGNGELGSSSFEPGAWRVAIGLRGKIGCPLRYSEGSTFGHESRRSRAHLIKPREHWGLSTASSMICCTSRPEHDAPPTLLLLFPYSYQFLFPFPSCTRPVPPPSSRIDRTTAAFARQFGKIRKALFRALPTSKTGSLEYNPLATEPSPVRASRLGPRQSYRSRRETDTMRLRRQRRLYACTRCITPVLHDGAYRHKLV